MRTPRHFSALRKGEGAGGTCFGRLKVPKCVLSGNLGFERGGQREYTLEYTLKCFGRLKALSLEEGRREYTF